MLREPFAVRRFLLRFKPRLCAAFFRAFMRRSFSERARLYDGRFLSFDLER